MNGGRHGEATGDALFRDLRQAEDPEAPVTASSAFPFLEGGTLDAPGVALPDPGSIVFHPAIVVELKASAEHWDALQRVASLLPYRPRRFSKYCAGIDGLGEPSEL